MNPFVNIHTHNIHIGNKEFIEIINIDVDNSVNVDVPFLFSIGLHPWDVGTQELSDSWIQSLDDLNLKAIGECGLDRVHCSDFEKQKYFFIRQIEISEQYHKPMIIHSVKTYSDIISIRKETKAKMPWIIHGFRGKEQVALDLLRHDCYLSFGARFQEEAVRAVPLERLFIETDESSESIEEICRRIAQVRGVSPEELAEAVNKNVRVVFFKR